jgi:hypothetical protein
MMLALMVYRQDIPVSIEPQKPQRVGSPAWACLAWQIPRTRAKIRDKRNSARMPAHSLIIVV